MLNIGQNRLVHASPGTATERQLKVRQLLLVGLHRLGHTEHCCLEGFAAER
jgi:hypothetical protein